MLHCKLYAKHARVLYQIVRQYDRFCVQPVLRAPFTASTYRYQSGGQRDNLDPPADKDNKRDKPSGGSCTAPTTTTSKTGTVIQTGGKCSNLEQFEKPSSSTSDQDKDKDKQDERSLREPHCKNPEHCVPAQSFWTSEPDVPVKLRLDRASLASIAEPTETVPQWFTRSVESFPGAPAMTAYRDGATVTWTYQEYLDDVRTAAKAFIHLGLEPYHSVAILGFNSPEWLISDIGAIFAGGLSVGVYTTNTPEACKFVAKAARSNIIVVEDDMQLRKILKYRSELPDIKAIIQYTGKPDRTVSDIYSWDELMEIGANLSDDELDIRQDVIAPNKCCTVIFTSGTTGVPKGAMLSHDNLIWTAKAAIRDGKILGEQTFVSYLPLSHVAAHLADVYLPITTGGHVHFAQPNALKDKGSLVKTLQTAKPTAMVGVPRVWEKMEEQIRVSLAKNTLLQIVFDRAMKIGMMGYLNSQTGKNPPLEWFWASWIFKLVRSKLGLDRCTHTCSGAAPLMRDTQEFFLSLNVPIYDIYGLSESSAPHSMNLPGAFKLGSAGRVLSGAKTKIGETDMDGIGEICMYGRHIFMGYLGMKERTERAFDGEGYFRSGDMGKVDKDGYLYVTGRLKEVIVTAGGEKVSPLPIEDKVKEQLPIVSHALLIGDKRRFVSVLLTLKSEMDLKKGQPLPELTEATMDWIKSKSGATVTTVEEAQDSEELNKAIENILEKVNETAASRAQRIKEVPDTTSRFQYTRWRARSDVKSQKDDCDKEI